MGRQVRFNLERVITLSKLMIRLKVLFNHYKLQKSHILVQGVIKWQKRKLKEQRPLSLQHNPHRRLLQSKKWPGITVSAAVKFKSIFIFPYFYYNSSDAQTFKRILKFIVRLSRISFLR